MIRKERSKGSGFNKIKNMKILLISSYLPYPLFSGGQIRLYNLLKELSRNHSVTLICEKRENQTDADIKEIEKICKKVITVNRRKQWSLQNILKAMTSQHSFLITGHTHEEMKRKIKEELGKNQFDLIHVETFYVMQNLPLKSRITTPPLLKGARGILPIVLVEHNIEYQVYSRFVKNAHFLLRPFLAIDVAKIKREEEYFWKKASRLIAVSNEDKEVMRLAGAEAEVVANGVDTDKFSYKNVQKAITQKEKKILFIGDFKWIQNRDTLSWIIRDIWPLIKKGVHKNIKLWIVGREIPDSIKSLTNDPDIIFDQKSSSHPAEQIFHEAYALLAPIRVGGGTSYKILEALSAGTPVIITPLSAQSLGLRDSEEALIGQNAKELADQTLLLLQDSNLYEKISKNGRALIEKNHTWKNIAGKLEEVYKDTVS